MSCDPRRKLALTALLAVQRGKPLAVELESLRRCLGAGPAAAAAEELVKGALQWQGRYDHLIRTFSAHRTPTDDRVRCVLLLALHELLARPGVPDYAALHQAGELLRSVGRPRAVGYVNAVLQKVRGLVAARAPQEPLVAVHGLFTDLEHDPASYLAAWWSHPRWLVERWLAAFGGEATAALLQHAAVPPPVTLHVLPGHDAARVRAALAALDCRASPVPGFARSLRLADRPDRSRLRELLAAAGGLLVQDAGAQGVVDWLTREGADLAAEQRPVADLCAAPGGKALHLRALLPATTLVVGMDLRPRRLALVRQNSERLGLAGLPLLAGDAVRCPLRPRSLAAVLLDGPCSGTGVMRHHPEGRWRLRPQTLRSNAQRLLALADAAVDLLVDGGRLYYATCSLEPEENEQVVAALLERRGDLAGDPDPDGLFQRHWLPWRDGTDGFYAARLRRRGRLDDGGRTREKA